MLFNESSDMENTNRSGRYIKQLENYSAFIPKPLPPDPSLDFDMELINLISEANRELGQLNGLASVISDHDLFVYMYIRKEALLSSQIEGTQCSLEDVLSEEMEDQYKNKEVLEVSNYIKAMNYGLEKLASFPVSNRLIKEIHTILLEDVRGAEKMPGEFRKSPNWIGKPGANLNNAAFVPPPPYEVNNCMSDLEKYIHSEGELPPLVKAAIIHVQFETIHPFLDGNGRLGRLLITFLMCSWGIMMKPLIYLSYFFKSHRSEYYQKLMDVRLKGDWEGWIKFFLRGVAETASMANTTALEIHEIHKKDLDKIQMYKSTTPTVNQLFSIFCRNPILEINELHKIVTEVNKVTIYRSVEKLESLGILHNVGNRKRNKVFSYKEYLDVLARDTKMEMG